MYTRAYSESDVKLSIPENYDGTAFLKKEEPPQARPIPPSVSEPKCSPRSDFPSAEKEAFAPSEPTEGGESGISSLIRRIPFGRLLGERGCGSIHLDRFKIGSEEVLIIVIALFLLFSREGDKECAIALLILLFIN